jgi:hypothetical protein
MRTAVQRGSMGQLRLLDRKTESRNEQGEIAMTGEDLYMVYITT